MNSGEPPQPPGPPRAGAIPDDVLERIAEKYLLRPGDGRPDDRLNRILAAYQHDPSQARVTALSWRNRDPRGFCQAVLHSPKETMAALAACPPLRRLLSVQLLLYALEDPRAYTRRDAVQIAAQLAQTCPRLDAILMQRSWVDPEVGGEPDPERVQRGLELLAEVSDSSGVFRFLVRATNTNDRRVVSKVALLAARIACAGRVVSELAVHDDPRVRANVMEGLWQAPDSARKRALLWQGVEDVHHRVVANALVGLTRMGEEEAFDTLARMLFHESRHFRAAAAWAIGEIGDPRFAPVLAGGLGRETGSVRQNIHKALVKLRKAETTPPSTGTPMGGESEPLSADHEMVAG